MLNRYPLWKYIMLVGVILVGLLYALPNIYGEDPAIQISGSRNAKITVKTSEKIEKIFNEKKIPFKSIIFENNTVLVRVATNDIQLKAKDIIANELGNNYVVALNLAPATPLWLSFIGAEPMKLGLDLRGGVHFLMEVDMATALDKLLDVATDALRNDFVNSNIEFSSLTKNYSIIQ